MDAEAATAQKKKSWRRITKTEQVALGIITVFFFLMIFLSGQRSFFPIPFQSSKNMAGLLHDSNEASATSCLSLNESALYRKSFPYNASSYLSDKLRNYEALHKKCAPNTPLYRKSIEQLISGHSTELMNCNYVVWIPCNCGLGNRILSLISTFLYAILSNRVLLIQLPNDMVDLFCEPFPNTTWTLPHDFPIKKLNWLNVKSRVTYGNMLDKHVISNDTNTKVELLPSYVYIHLVEDCHDLDKLFFCSDDQIVLGKINWLLLKSDLYFAPSLFSTSLFEEELDRLFPAKESVFYLLANYLIHPSDTVWEMVKKYYMSYLVKADEIIGIQVRVFSVTKVSHDVVFQQILNCSKVENVLPGFDLNGTQAFKSNEQKSKAILVVSLYADFYKKFKSMYYDNSEKTRKFVSVYQPSNEKKQKKRNRLHNQKALTDIYLLSFCDVLIISGWSTFGYVSYGLGGIKPVILMPIWGKNIPDQPCVKEVSMEPCYIVPAKPICKGKTTDEKKLQQYVKQCPDFSPGTKLFN